jgi:hypothetical protein
MAVVLVAAAALPRDARSQCGTDPLWTYQASPPGATSTVASDAGWGLGLNFASVGSAVDAIWSETVSGAGGHQAGTLKWSYSNPSLAPAGAPVPAELAGGGEFVFVTTQDGFLHKIDVATGLGSSVDARRTIPGGPLVCAADQVHATPAIQLYAHSNSTFQTNVMAIRGHPDDLVFVFTKNGCLDGTHNTVTAFWASDLTRKWIFNSNTSNSVPAPYAVGGIPGGGGLDYTTNTLHFGTSLENAIAGQASFWALNSVTGARKWSYNAGSILNRPTLGSGRVYFASENGRLYSMSSEADPQNPFVGLLLWSTSVTPAGITRNVWPEFRPPATILLLTGADGRMYRVDDLGSSATPVWSTPAGSQYSSMPVLVGASDKIYLGRSDGRVQQVNLNTGFPESTRSSSFASTIADPTLDFSTAPNQLDRLLVPGTAGVVERYCIPWDPSVDVDDLERSSALPLRNSPNPFHDTTRIDYDLPESAHVELAIYDVAGRRLRTLVDGDRSDGRNTIEWDGRDAAGQALPRGVYFCRLHVVGTEHRVRMASRPLLLAH